MSAKDRKSFSQSAPVVDEVALNRRAALTAIAAGTAATVLAAEAHATSFGRKDAAASSGRSLPAIIDVHAHPPMLSFMAALRRNNADGQPRLPELRSVMRPWTPEEGVALMDRHGIGATVMSNPLGFAGETGQSAVDLARRVNDDMAEVIAKYPRRYGAFAMLPLRDIDASMTELVRALDELRFDGVCLLTNVDGFYPGSNQFGPIFAELNRRRSTAFVHPFKPWYVDKLNLPFETSLMEFMIDSNRAAASLVFSGMRARYPDFTYIATHGGGTTPFLVHRFETGKSATAAYGIEMTPDEIRRGFQSLHYEMTAATGAEQLAATLQLVDSTRMLLGFDVPMRSAALIDPSRAELASSPLLNQQDVDRIARGNALRLLPRLGERLGE